MTVTAFGLAVRLQRLERERSYDACVQVAEALGCRLMLESGSMRLDIPGGRYLSVYFQLETVVDDLIAVARQALGWSED